MNENSVSFSDPARCDPRPSSTNRTAEVGGDLLFRSCTHLSNIEHKHPIAT
jgi:hypothetical protein